ncbi:MAG: PIN domain-containing protein [Candidatus Lokiarchaeota archaeon]|nr:PIN domain-containing protein [Candidatus Lokiarchaeota archaeon]MBD3199787.1 PIN domain-containing protein [Candidatus Lokiarchaeota archaeon]
MQRETTLKKRGRIIKIVVDASIIVKWFIQEKDSDKAKLIREKYIDGDIELIAPSLMYFEVLNALKYSELFESSELNDAAESLEKYGFTIITIKNNLRKNMIKIAVDHKLSIYDASYLALSLGLGKIFCTADEKIIKKLPATLKSKVKRLKYFEEIFR